MILPDAGLGLLHPDELEDALAEPGAHPALGLAAGGEAHVALLVDKDGEGEGGALHPPRPEPELVPHRQEAPEHLGQGSVCCSKVVELHIHI